MMTCLDHRRGAAGQEKCLPCRDIIYQLSKYAAGYSLSEKGLSVLKQHEISDLDLAVIEFRIFQKSQFRRLKIQKSKNSEMETQKLNSLN